MASCGSCEACGKTEDCTKCENCILNYIEKYIKFTNNQKPCLERICHATLKDDSNMRPSKGQGTSEPKINIKQINNSLSLMELSEVKKMELDERGVETDLEMDPDEKGPTKNEIKVKQSEPEAENNNIKMERSKTEFDKMLDDWENNQSEKDYGEVGNEQQPANMCGKCLGCTAADCGRCWSCIEKDTVASKELASQIICKAKICFNVKGKKKGTGFKGNEESKNRKSESKHRRKRCGSCLGCKVTQNCGICNNCIRKQNAKLAGKTYWQTCTVRQCHVLKSEKNQRCGKCDGCQSLPCGDCIFCNGPNPQFCRAKRCQNPSWIKKKTIAPKTDKKLTIKFSFKTDKILKKTEINEDKILKKTEIKEDLDTIKDEQTFNVESICPEEDPSLERVNDWLNKNFEEETLFGGSKKQDDLKDNLKRGPSKHIKRTMNCGNCAGCNAKDCGNCESCKINQQFGEDNLVLGKAPCLMYSCKFPVEVRGEDMLSLMANQDDALVCPIKVVDGIPYDYRCYFCKKLPRAGMANRSELLRHYSTVHFSEEIRKEFSDFFLNGYCHLCDAQFKSSAVSHFGQKHDEVLKYLPQEAVAICPKNKVMLQRRTRAPQNRPKIEVGKKTSKESDWPVPEGFDASAPDRNQGWKGDSPNEDVMFEEREFIIVDGWRIDMNIAENSEPLPNENDSDYNGVGGVCNICKTEFSEVTKAAMHLHDEHKIKGGSSYIMRDCENFINKGFIQLLPQQKETRIGEVSVIKHTKEIAESSDNAGGSLELLASPESHSNKVRMSTNTTPKSFSKPSTDGETVQPIKAVPIWKLQESEKEVPSSTKQTEVCSSHAEHTDFYEAVGLVSKVEEKIGTSQKD